MAWLLSASAEEASLAAVVAAPACPSSVKALALPPGVEASRLQGSHLIVVLKGARRILRMNQGKLLETKDGPACWPIGLGFAPTGTKAVEGDGRTPEGLYATSDKPWSQYYAAIAVHYPGPHDLEEAIQTGRLDAATADSVRAAHQRGEKPPHEPHSVAHRRQPGNKGAEGIEDGSVCDVPDGKEQSGCDGDHTCGHNVSHRPGATNWCCHNRAFPTNGWGTG